MALVELARRDQAPEPVPLAQISATQEISLPYLEQIFVDLRRHGVVTSMRGKQGGYRLANPVDEIKLGQIIDAVDEAVDVTRCQSHDGCLSQSTRCLTHDLWFELGRHIRQFFDAISLADVVSGNLPQSIISAGPNPLLEEAVWSPRHLERGLGINDGLGVKAADERLASEEQTQGAGK